jgi:hypothetical protein
MTNKEFLERASKLQKEYAELYDKAKGLAGICNNYIHVRDEKFHEFEKENLLEHISKELRKEDTGDYWRYEAMTPDGVKIIALEFTEEMEGK